MYHGILIDAAFTDPGFPTRFTVFATRKSVSIGWVLYGIEIADDDIARCVDDVRTAMKAGRPYYAHFYNDAKLIVVFKDRVIEAAPHRSTWQPAIDYGSAVGIPMQQLDFWPNRFQDEIHYFAPDDFIRR